MYLFISLCAVLAEHSEVLLKAGKEEVCMSVKCNTGKCVLLKCQIKCIVPVVQSILPTLFSTDAQAVL